MKSADRDLKQQQFDNEVIISKWQFPWRWIFWQNFWSSRMKWVIAGIWRCNLTETSSSTLLFDEFEKNFWKGLWCSRMKWVLTIRYQSFWQEFFHRIFGGKTGASTLQFDEFDAAEWSGFWRCNLTENRAYEWNQQNEFDFFAEIRGHTSGFWQLSQRIFKHTKWSFDFSIHSKYFNFHGRIFEGSGFD